MKVVMGRKVHTFAVTTWPSLSTLSIVPVGKKGRMSRNDRTRYLRVARNIQQAVGHDYWPTEAGSR